MEQKIAKFSNKIEDLEQKLTQTVNRLICTHNCYCYIKPRPDCIYDISEYIFFNGFASYNDLYNILIEKEYYTSCNCNFLVGFNVIDSDVYAVFEKW